jgi:hypothetical protein
MRKRSINKEGEMATKRTTRTTKKVKNLAAKKVSPKRAKNVKGGGGEFVITEKTDKGSVKLL